jgi:hypothetical protein
MASPNDKLVFAKTSKGVAEVATRGGALNMAARRVLIMIDGRRSVAELGAMLRNSELDVVINLLEAQGFISRQGSGFAGPTTMAFGLRVDEPRESTLAPREALDVNTVANDSDERPLVTIEEAKRRAVRELTERLGPEAEIMAIRLEQTRTAEELRERLREAERLVAGLMGEAAAADYLRALRNRR